MTNVLIVLTLPEPMRMQYFNHLRQHFPEVKLDLVDHHTKVDPYIGAAEVLITFGPHVASHVFDKAKSLKWVQALGTGVDGIADQPGLRQDVVLTNMHGFHGGPVSEAALLAMLSLARNLPRSLSQQAGRKWERFPVKLLKGKTVGIFGVGTIAAELAPKCKALGMKVVGVSSTKRAVPGFDAMHGRDELEQAVKERRIAGAALDVFAKEPLPEDSPFWDMENVILTQHQGGFFDGYPGFALPVVEENMRKYLAGDLKGMINVVKR